MVFWVLNVLGQTAVRSVSEQGVSGPHGSTHHMIDCSQRTRKTDVWAGLCACSVDGGCRTKYGECDGQDLCEGCHDS